MEIIILQYILDYLTLKKYPKNTDASLEELDINSGYTIQLELLKENTNFFKISNTDLDTFAGKNFPSSISVVINRVIYRLKYSAVYYKDINKIIYGFYNEEFLDLNSRQIPNDAVNMVILKHRTIWVLCTISVYTSNGRYYSTLKPYQYCKVIIFQK